MPPLPQLIQEDAEEIQQALLELLAKTQAELALVAAEGGFVIFKEGRIEQFDTSSLGALASNAFTANQAIASLIQEPSFRSIYQEGEKFSMLVSAVDTFHSLIVIFAASVSVGLIKYYVAFAADKIAAQLKRARERAPGQGFDPALLNLSDAADLFHWKKSP